MKFYLSSYKIGDKPEKLKALFIENTKVGYIPNALDSANNNPAWLKEHIHTDMALLKGIGLEVELLDLKRFFTDKEALSKKLNELGGVWISGGNVFILRRAMYLAGFDAVLKSLARRKNFVYGGYSAAVCVLSSRLHAYQIVDNPHDDPYQTNETLWEGFGLIDYIFLPHFNSNHSESEDINKEMAYCIKHNLKYKTAKDGDVIIME